MIIATIPGVFRRELTDKILKDELIDAVRFNTGVPSPDTAYDTLVQLKTKTSKPIWIDLKCRQLRIARWCVPYYGEVELNHEIELELPAHVHFRGGEQIEIKRVQGNKIYLAEPPEQAIGQGQSINIHAESLNIKGYLTEEDIRYIKAAEAMGLNHFMLSFYEGLKDIEMFREQLKHPENVKIGMKIESHEGLRALDELESKIDDDEKFISKQNLTIVVARDDLLENLEQDVILMLSALKNCLEIDKDAIVASQFFLGLEHTGSINAADISDIHLLHIMGYKNFMLSDEICLRHFSKVVSAWEDYETWDGIL